MRAYNARADHVAKEPTMLRVLSLSPNTVFLNASGIITMADPIRLDRELTALAVKDGRIIALGPDTEITRMAEGAEIVDLQGAMVMPGLIDCHIISSVQPWAGTGCNW